MKIQNKTDVGEFKNIVENVTSFLTRRFILLPLKQWCGVALILSSVSSRANIGI
jgi:hypothetical protein